MQLRFDRPRLGSVILCQQGKCWDSTKRQLNVGAVREAIQAIPEGTDFLVLKLPFGSEERLGWMSPVDLKFDAYQRAEECVQAAAERDLPVILYDYSPVPICMMYQRGGYEEHLRKLLAMGPAAIARDRTGQSDWPFTIETAGLIRDHYWIHPHTKKKVAPSVMVGWEARLHEQARRGKGTGAEWRGDFGYRELREVGEKPREHEQADTVLCPDNMFRVIDGDRVIPQPGESEAWVKSMLATTSVAVGIGWWINGCKPERMR